MVVIWVSNISVRVFGCRNFIPSYLSAFVSEYKKRGKRRKEGEEGETRRDNASFLTFSLARFRANR